MPSFIRTKEDERLWSKAQDLAAEAGHEDNWAYVTGIFKKMRPNHAFKNKGAVDETAARQLLSHLLASLRAAQQSHWTAHWQVQGTGFYGDHLMFERFYNALTAEIDGLAEKMVALFGGRAVNFPEQMKWQTYLAFEWDKYSDHYYKGYHIEKYLQEHFLRTYRALKGLQQTTLGLDDFLMTIANAHETNQYLLGQRIGNRMKAATANRKNKYKVYLFSDVPNAKPLWTKTFMAENNAKADIAALRLVKPILKKHDNAEDWVVEPVGHKGKAASPRHVQEHVDDQNIEYAVYQLNNGRWASRVYDRDAQDAVNISIYNDKLKAIEAYKQVVKRLASREAHPSGKKVPNRIYKEDGKKFYLTEHNVMVTDPRYVKRKQRENWSKGVRDFIERVRVAKSNQKSIVTPHNFFPVKVLPPQAKRKEFPFEGFIDFQGLKIDVENKAGSTRRGEGPEGPWSTYMHSHYGEIRGTEGADGDKLDVYVGENHDSTIVVVIHQHNPWDGKYDEDKVMVGYDSVQEAIGAYLKQYDRPGFYIENKHTAMNIGKFWRWCHDKNNKGKKVSSRHTAVQAEPLDYVSGSRKGWLAIKSGGDIASVTQTLNAEMVRRVPPPQSVMKIRGAHKAFSFHWSNAQVKWDVMMLREFPWDLDGAEFIVFTGKKTLSPLGKTWSLAEMRYVAKGLHKHSGYASSPESTYRQAAQVGTDTASIIAIAPEMLKHLAESGTWLKEWEKHPGSDAGETLIRQHGGAVFHTGGDGDWDVQIPGALDGWGYLPPYGTKDFKTPNVSGAKVGS